MKDLLNRLQTHNWTEYSSLNQVLNPTPVEYVSPDSLFERQLVDEFGSFEPIVDLTEAMARLGSNEDV